MVDISVFKRSNVFPCEELWQMLQKSLLILNLHRYGLNAVPVQVKDSSSRVIFKFYKKEILNRLRRVLDLSKKFLGLKIAFCSLSCCNVIVYPVRIDNFCRKFQNI